VAVVLGIVALVIFTGGDDEQTDDSLPAQTDVSTTIGAVGPSTTGSAPTSTVP
jgi:hypothetical protein